MKESCRVSDSFFSGKAYDKKVQCAFLCHPVKNQGEFPVGIFKIS